jgi:hypothetical protein
MSGMVAECHIIRVKEPVKQWFGFAFGDTQKSAQQYLGNISFHRLAWYYALIEE